MGLGDDLFAEGVGCGCVGMGVGARAHDVDNQSINFDCVIQYNFPSCRQRLYSNCSLHLSEISLTNPKSRLEPIVAKLCVLREMWLTDSFMQLPPPPPTS